MLAFLSTSFCFNWQIIMLAQIYNALYLLIPTPYKHTRLKSHVFKKEV